MNQNNANSFSNEFLTMNQLIEVTGVDRSHANQLVSISEIGTENIDGEVVFSLDDVDKVREIVQLSTRKKAKAGLQYESTKRREIVTNSFNKPVRKPKEKKPKQSNFVDDRPEVDYIDQMLNVVNGLALSVNKLTERVEQLEKASSAMNISIPTYHTTPDSKVYNGPFNDDLMTEAYSDYHEYIKLGIISDLNGTKLKQLEADIILALDEHYAYDGKPMSVHSLMMKLAAKTNSRRFWIIAALGSLRKRSDIAKTVPRNIKFPTEKNVSLWSSLKFSEHKEKVIGNKPNVVRAS